MKRILKPLLLLSALLFFSPQAAIASSYVEGVGNKLAHGMANLVTGIGEVPKNMVMTTNEKGIGYGLTTGLMSGIVNGIGRSLTGIVDLVTFYVPTKPLITPGYIWQDFQTTETHFNNDWKIDY
ncbi:MAG: exosortase system-associated protein, TIGR04073 family [Nitrosospira sp.]